MCEKVNIMQFLMGIACVATGKVLYEKKGFIELQSIIKEITKEITDKELLTLKDSLDLSYAEKLYLEYKNEVIRGGSADLLAVTVFLCLVEEFMNKIILNGIIIFSY